MLTGPALAAAIAALSPVVVHDTRERHPLSAVDGPPAAYARAAPAKDDGTWLQFWLYYEQQDQDRGIVRTGRHAGDWEMVQLRLDRGGRPVEAVYAQHAVAERCPWAVVERRAGHPVVYVARGAHGSYFRPGVRDRMWPDPNDEADGRGLTLRPRVVRVSATSPEWMRSPERWGGARAAWWNPAEQDSPRGPAFQGQGRWTDPDAWARAATPCRAERCDEVDECDTRETLLGAGAVGAVLAGVVVWWRRRRRPRRLHVQR